MATTKTTGVMTYVDENGNHHILCPVTTAQAVSGLGEALGALQTAADTHASSRENPHKVTLTQLDAQKKHTAATCTLTAAGWSNLTQTVSISGVSGGNTVVVTPAPASVEAYGDAGVRCTAQTSGKLTFLCSAKPAADLTVQVLILD